MLAQRQFKARVHTFTPPQGVLLTTLVVIFFLFNVFLFVKDDVQAPLLVVFDSGRVLDRTCFLLFILLEDVVGRWVLAISDVFVKVFDLLDQEKFVFLGEVVEGTKGVVKVLVNMLILVFFSSPSWNSLLLVSIIDKIEHIEPTSMIALLPWRTLYPLGLCIIGITSEWVMHPLIAAISIECLFLRGLLILLVRSLKRL